MSNHPAIHATSTAVDSNSWNSLASGSANPLREHVRLHRAERLAHWMDTAFVVPGTTRRVGLDSLIGLVPGVGDLLTTAVSGWIVREAIVLGASKLTIAKMLLNIGIDLTIGIIPLVGDLFDFGFKANLKNVRLLRRHLDRSSGPTVD